jgi:2-polyprenyl-3-methyl-5-hydroxy-6-metoxy-1,4-benzoquinol methylase
MAANIHYTNCPFCGSNNFKQVLTVKDYTVSNEMFEVCHCSNCTNKFTQNIANQDGIGKYYQSDNYISHSDTSKDFISKIYHAVRNITLKKKRKLIISLTNKTQGNLLDVGAGTGAFTNTMQQFGWKVTALEPDETARAVAKQKYNIELQNPSMLYNLPKENFDAITLWHVLEHIHTLKEYLQQFHIILKKDGKLLIAVPNYTSYDAQHYQEFWAGYDVPRHLYHFSPTGMEKLANDMGFKLVAAKPMWFDSVYVAMLSEQYKTGKPSLIKAFIIGMISNAKAVFNNKKCSSVIYILEKK